MTFPFVLAAEAVYESVREKRRISLARAQRRDLQHDLGQSIIQILAKSARRNLARQLNQVQAACPNADVC